MSYEVSVFLRTDTNDVWRLDSVRQFVFRKEKYTPYTELSLTVQDDKGIIIPKSSIIQVQLAIGRAIVHIGLADSADCRIENGLPVVNIRSKGYTSLLTGNQMTPGVHPNMSLEKLMTSYYDFPYPVQWESDIAECNYIFVKEHQSMWDSVVNLGYKLYGTYPYIRSANRISLRPHSNPQHYTFTKSEMLAYGWQTKTSGILSHLHMQDIDGSYGKYNLENRDAEDLLIVRHKQIAFDRQYLDDPERSMNLTFALASKGWRSRYLTISGYRPFDLNDYAGAEDFFEESRICAVTVTGNASGLQTTYTIYEDGFSES